MFFPASSSTARPISVSSLAVASPASTTPWRCPFPRKELSCAARDRALHHLASNDLELCLWNADSAGHYAQLSQVNAPTRFAWNRRCERGRISALFALGSIERADDLRDCCADNDTFRIFLATEPPAVQPEVYAALAPRTGDFDAVLSLAGPALVRGDNVIRWPFGSSWVPLAEWQVFPKTRLCSIIASKRRDFEGHRLRHAAVDALRAAGFDCDVLGRGYREVGSKREGLVDYMFSIVVENSREEGSNYMTEKLVDALACGTVPVYWGNKVAERHFGQGLIVWDTVEELRDKVCPRLTRATYEAMLPAVRANLEEAKKFAPPERWLCEFGCVVNCVFLKSLTLNFDCVNRGQRILVRVRVDSGQQGQRGLPAEADRGGGIVRMWLGLRVYNLP